MGSPRVRVVRRGKRKGKHQYRSGYEAQFARWLDSSKIKYEYEAHTLDYMQKVSGSLCMECGSHSVKKLRTYTPDFYLPDYDMFIETKGRFTSVERSKMKAIQESNPTKDVRMLFQRDHYITTKKKIKYTDWCTSRGIKSSTGIKLPPEWLQE